MTRHERLLLTEAGIQAVYTRASSNRQSRGRAAVRRNAQDVGSRAVRGSASR